MGEPKLVKPEQLKKIAEFRTDYPDFKPSMKVKDSFFGSIHVEPGQVWPDRLDGEEGQMIILDAWTYGITYERKGRAYFMTADDFQDNLRSYGMIEGGRGARGMARLAEIEMMFLMGALSATGAAGLVLVLGVQTSQWVAENRKHFKKWATLAAAFLAMRANLKKEAPTLYDRLSAGYWGAVKDNFWDTIKAEDVAFLVGQLVVSPGLGWLTRTFDATWKAILKAMAITLMPVAVRGGVGALKIIPYTAQEMKATADALTKSLRDAGVSVSGAQAKLIEGEVTAHGPVVIEAFHDLKEAMDKVEAMGDEE